MRIITNAHHKIGHSLTVKELRDELENFPDDAVVLIVSDYGDHCHTQQAQPIESIDELGCSEVLEESAYSHSGIALREVDFSFEDEDTPESHEAALEAASEIRSAHEATNVVIIRL